MADLTGAIARTIKRLMVGGKALEGPTWLPKLYDGLSKEFGRVNDYRQKVLAAAIPNENTPVEALDDLEAKYGIENYLGFTDQERLARVIEGATGGGSGGVDWLQEQVQKAGFPLYVITNVRRPTSQMQWGAFQFSTSAEYGLSILRINPSSVPGRLICSSPQTKAGRRYLGTSQWGGFQFGGPAQYGEVDPSFSYPQPAPFRIPSNPLYWGRFFFLSPFPASLAINDGELLSMTAEGYHYFRRLIIQTKYLRDWCIAQVKVV